MSEPQAKRYMLFGGESYYARGGLNDYIESFDELHEATARASELEGTRRDFQTYEWFHVVDIMAKAHIVWRSDALPYGAPERG